MDVEGSLLCAQESVCVLRSEPPEFRSGTDTSKEESGQSQAASTACSRARSVWSVTASTHSPLCICTDCCVRQECRLFYRKGVLKPSEHVDEAKTRLRSKITKIVDKTDRR